MYRCTSGSSNFFPTILVRYQNALLGNLVAYKRKRMDFVSKIFHFSNARKILHFGFLGKNLQVFFPPFTKGDDFYDFLFYDFLFCFPGEENTSIHGLLLKERICSLRSKYLLLRVDFY